MQIKSAYPEGVAFLTPTEKERQGIEALLRKKWRKAEKIFDAVLYENMGRILQVGIYVGQTENRYLIWRYMTGMGMKLKPPKPQVASEPARCPTIDEKGISTRHRCFVSPNRE